MLGSCWEPSSSGWSKQAHKTQTKKQRNKNIGGRSVLYCILLGGVGHPAEYMKNKRNRKSGRAVNFLYEKNATNMKFKVKVGR